MEFSDQGGRVYASLGLRPDQVMVLRYAPETAEAGRGHSTVASSQKAESDEPVCLSPAEEEELLESWEQIRRGEYVEGADLLKELRSRSQS